MPPPPPSHVIVIQADDLGVDDLYFSGNALAHTPNLDRLAADSVRAIDFTVNAVCAPSRATLLTGRHFLRTGVSHVNGGKDYLHLSEKTMADAFGQAGWGTAMWGKWHLGTEPGYFPWERGFEEAYMAKLYAHEASFGWINGREIQHEDWADQVIVDYAIEYLQRPREGPAFLYLPSLSPHTPLRAPESWIQFHRDRGTPEKLAVLNAMVSNFDEQIGRLIDALETSGLLANTLIVVTSDNGPAVNRGILSDEERRLRKVSSRRGWKGDLWENGVRAPLLMHWPERLEPGTIAVPMDQVDLLPTLLDWCGVPWPNDFPKLDGKSRRALIESDAVSRVQDSNAPTTFNYVHTGWITSERPWTPAGLPGEYNPVTRGQASALDWSQQPISVREGRFKLVRNALPPETGASGFSMLVDLYEDPGETTDVSDKFPDTAAHMEAKLQQWFTGVTDAPQSFTAPVVTVPETGASIRAFLVTELAGSLNNTSSDLRGWTSASDRADYILKVERSGVYEIALEWGAAPGKGTQFIAEMGFSRTSATTDGEGLTPLGELRLEEGVQRLVVSCLPGASDLENSHLEHIQISPKHLEH